MTVDNSGTTAGFLSTLPARGATQFLQILGGSGTNFYPRSPRGERPVDPHLQRALFDISIHAPREGSDPGDRFLRFVESIFLSTLPARGATLGYKDLDAGVLLISIHAPREGSDIHPRPGRHAGRDFYPRSPRGERLSEREQAIIQELFLSTLPARGATQSQRRSRSSRQNFYPRSPRGERRQNWRRSRSRPGFLSTLPARGATRQTCPS